MSKKVGRNDGSDLKEANDVAGTEPTIDTEQAKENRKKHESSFYEGVEEIPNSANDARKKGTDDGNKQ